MEPFEVAFEVLRINVILQHRQSFPPSWAVGCVNHYGTAQDDRLSADKVFESKEVLFEGGLRRFVFIRFAFPKRPVARDLTGVNLHDERRPISFDSAQP